MNLPNAIAAGSALTFVIANVPVPTAGAGIAQIPIQLLSQNAVGATLESRVFWDYITPLTETAGSVSATGLTVTLNTNLGGTGARYQFTSIQVSKAMPPNGKIIFEFPLSYNLNAAPITMSAPATGSFEVYGNLILYTPAATLAASSSATYTFDGITNPPVLDAAFK